MDLTTLDRVKTLRGVDLAASSNDAVIEQIIAGVSARVESVLGRHVETGTFTENYEIHKAARVVILRGFPVTSVDSLKYTYEPNDTAGTELVANEDYYLDAASGMLRLRVWATPYDPGYLAIEYDGGMAADTAAFIAAFPAISAACDTQCLHEYNRKASPGSNIETRDGKSTFGQAEVNLLAGVREVLGMYSRSTI